MSTTIGQAQLFYINGSWRLNVTDATGSRDVALTDPVQTALSSLLTAIQNTTDPQPGLPNDGGDDGATATATDGATAPATASGSGSAS